MLAMIKKQTPPNLKYIKKIITDATPSKSKWANDERDGQEQLYEALEKVLNSLKNYHVCINIRLIVQEHSQPFLKPVNKRDAPTYYDGNHTC
ncbi:hypothetical protein BC833DRAFT_605614 [Globomyces pollinis-pini]|nr:hypothetical protein BC833DRAFT_605614 [Globomyces pollinis-pini]